MRLAARLARSLLVVAAMAATVSADPARAAQPTIVIGPGAASEERFAAAELRRYVGRLTGTVLTVREVADAARVRGELVAVGRLRSNPVLADMARRGLLAARAPGPEGYRIRTVRYRGARSLAVVADRPLAVRHAAYALLERLGARFQLSGDVLPERRGPFAIPALDVAERPAHRRRGLLPWFDFINGPSAFSLEHFREYVDQLVKQRMNTLLLHVYQGAYTADERQLSEPFLGFRHRGRGYAAWLDTSLEQVRWGLSPFETRDLAFGADELFGEEVLASDAARRTWEQRDAQRFVTAKAKAMLREVIAYAQRRGVEVVLGTDIDLLPLELERAGAEALSEEVLAARLDDMLASYPTLRYVQFYASELNAALTTDQLVRAYTFLHDRLTRRRPGARLVTGGWREERRFAELDARLPPGVILSTLSSAYSSRDPRWGDVRSGRERWPIPWLEFDGALSEPQYAVGRLSRSLAQWRAEGVEGMFGIHWTSRLVAPNAAYLAQDAWSPAGRSTSPRAFYRDLAEASFGPEVAGRAAAALALYEADERATTIAKLSTPEFKLGGFDRWFSTTTKPDAPARLRTAREVGRRLAALRPEVRGAARRARLDFQLALARWVQEFYAAVERVPAAVSLRDAEAAWEALKRSRFRNSIEAYKAMVNDRAAQGGLISAAGGRWYEEYLQFERLVVARLAVRPPQRLRARGTARGALLSWRPYDGERRGVPGFHVYRRPATGGPARRLTRRPVGRLHHRDTARGTFAYAVTAVDARGRESPRSYEEVVHAGAADRRAPRVVVIPAEQSVLAGEPLRVTALVVDEQAPSRRSATLRYRALGATRWRSVPMARVLRGAFSADVPARVTAAADALEWYVVASDGRSAGRFPAGAPAVSASSAVLPRRGPAPGRLAGLRAIEASAPGRPALELRWEHAGPPPHSVRIYRSRSARFAPSGASFVTFVAGEQRRFVDVRVAARARYHYKLQAVSVGGRTSSPATTVATVGAARGVSIRVNAGGARARDLAPDRAKGSRSWGYDERRASGAGAQSGIGLLRPGPDPIALLSFRRAGGDVLAYRFDVPRGRYRVRLGFAEVPTAREGDPAAGDPGDGGRVFAIELEGRLRAQRFDIRRAAGGVLRGVQRRFDVDVADGTLDVVLRRVAGEPPQVNAIRVDSIG